MRIAGAVGLVVALALGTMAQSAYAAGVGVAAAKLCDARTYGAKADGVTKDTKAIQAAIDDCASAGGGTVRLSGGTFLTGPVAVEEQHHAGDCEGRGAAGLARPRGLSRW